jgi:hypothetical protein
MVASGVPVVVDASVARGLVEHERSALVADRGESTAFAGAINGLIALPALQRQYVGEDFAAHARARWNGHAVAEAYAERFAALAGRPWIPAELRAA